jgi:hypothetical protein
MTDPRGQYAKVLKKVSLDVPKRIKAGLEMTIIETMNRLIERTPVDTGAAKYHWFIRTLPNEKFDKTKVDKTGTAARQRAKQDVKRLTVGTRIYMVNSAPYFFYLEHGTSQQAPAGVVTITYAEMGLLFKRNIKASFGQQL